MAEQFFIETKLHGSVSDSGICTQTLKFLKIKKSDGGIRCYPGFGMFDQKQAENAKHALSATA